MCNFMVDLKHSKNRWKQILIHLLMVSAFATSEFIFLCSLYCKEGYCCIFGFGAEQKQMVGEGC